MIANLGSMIVLSGPSETAVPSLASSHNTVSFNSLHRVTEIQKANEGKIRCNVLLLCRNLRRRCVYSMDRCFWKATENRDAIQISSEELWPKKAKEGEVSSSHIRHEGQKKRRCK